LGPSVPSPVVWCQCHSAALQRFHNELGEMRFLFLTENYKRDWSPSIGIDSPVWLKFVVMHASSVVFFFSVYIIPWSVHHYWITLAGANCCSCNRIPHPSADCLVLCKLPAKQLNMHKKVTFGCQPDREGICFQFQHSLYQLYCC